MQSYQGDRGQNSFACQFGNDGTSRRAGRGKTATPKRKHASPAQAVRERILALTYLWHGHVKMMRPYQTVA
jgi:hypothetical protein